MSKAALLMVVRLLLVTTLVIISSCSSIDTTKIERIDTFIDLEPPPSGHQFSAIKVEITEDHDLLGVRYVAGQDPVEAVRPTPGSYLLKKQNDELKQQGSISALRLFFAELPDTIDPVVRQQLRDRYSALQAQEIKRIYQQE